MIGPNIEYRMAQTQSIARTPPAAARTPARDAARVFALLLLLDALAPLVEDELEEAPDEVAAVPEESVGVADAGGYAEPRALTSNGWEVAYIFVWSVWSAIIRVYPVAA